MKNKALYWGFGILSFLISLITLTMTVQPTVPFWDCGEFSASAIWQQVPHPPGTPLFMFFGKLFHILLPFGDEGWRINMLSVVAGAITIWLLYFIIVKVIVNLRQNSTLSLGDEIAIYGSALVGALAFAFSDTFWFNSVESEVYASSTLFVALILYMMMRWNEVADKVGHERYLILIFYLIGLSTGVHLLAILTVYSVAILVYFRKYEFKFSSFIVMGITAVVIFFFVYQGVVQYIPKLIAGGLGGVLFLLIVTAGLAAGTYYFGYNKKKSFIGLLSSGLFLMIFGYTTYSAIVIRSNANSPMNENEPKSFVSLTRYLGREQYGEQRLWPRRTDYNDQEKIEIYLKKDEKGEFVYGPWEMPQFVPEGERMVPKYNLPLMGELKYMWDYQINHMYIRYFLWNFVGRSSDEQDAPATWFTSDKTDSFNYLSGYAGHFPVKFFALPLLFGLLGLFFQFWKDPKLGFNYLMLFLLMGVLTALAQNQQNPQPRERDYFYAGSFLVWCIWVGLGAYMLIDWLAEVMKKKRLPAYLSALVIAVSLLAVPFNMAVGGWKIHSRAGNYLAFDYSYNILQSCEPDAILFTAGDNDTFPVWFLQDVMGVRRDVRVVNLSLGNTQWYIDQLKNRSPWGAKKIPLSFPDASIQVHETDPGALGSYEGPPENVVIKVNPEIMKKYTTDPEILKNSTFAFTYKGASMQGRNYFRVQDQLVKDILTQCKFERPVYFSSTAMNSDNLIGLDDYLRLEGMAYRICPVKQAGNDEYSPCDPKVMDATLLNVDNSNNYSKEFKYGFKFRNLNNPDVYYDRIQSRYMTNFRRLYMSYVQYALFKMKDNARVIKILDTMNENIGIENFPMEYTEEFIVYSFYMKAGAKDKAEKFMKMCEKSCLYVINNPDKLNYRGSRLREYDFLQFDYKYPDNITNRVITPYGALVNIYKNSGRIDEAERMIERLYGDWFLELSNNSARRQKINAISEGRVEFNRQDEDVIFLNNLTLIQMALVNFKLENLKPSATIQEKTKILEAFAARFKKNIERDQFLSRIYGSDTQIQGFIKAKIEELKPKTEKDSLVTMTDSSAAMQEQQPKDTAKAK